MKIKLDCYVNVLDEFKEKYPNDHFEIITREDGHPLSPSWNLINDLKSRKISFDEYVINFNEEMKEPIKMKKIDELITILNFRNVFLVCYERDSSVCHRTYVKLMILNKMKTKPNKNEFF